MEDVLVGKIYGWAATYCFQDDIVKDAENF